nr:hypothetical protein [Zobellia sp. B3R18]
MRDIATIALEAEKGKAGNFLAPITMNTIAEADKTTDLPYTF